MSHKNGRLSKVRVFLSTAGKYRWNLKGPNGEIVADGAEGYNTLRSCLGGIASVKKTMRSATVVLDPTLKADVADFKEAAKIAKAALIAIVATPEIAEVMKLDAHGAKVA